MSALALLCQCHGYRYTHGKLLYFSVKERMLLQKRQFKEAEKLLENVLREADAYYDTHAQAYEARQAKVRKSQAKLKDYDLVEPPREVVIQPAGKRLVSGNPDYSEDDLMSGVPLALGVEYEQMMKGLAVSSRGLFKSQLGPVIASLGTHYSPARLMQLVTAGVITEDQLPDVLRPPVYEATPERRGPSPYALLEKELEDKLRDYPKVVWQKIDTERNFIANDAKMSRQVLKQRQATNRAIGALVESGQVVGKGERVNTIYLLANYDM